jgi:hypothetical protein
MAAEPAAARLQRRRRHRQGSWPSARLALRFAELLLSARHPASPIPTASAPAQYQKQHRARRSPRPLSQVRPPRCRRRGYRPPRAELVLRRSFSPSRAVTVATCTSSCGAVSLVAAQRRVVFCADLASAPSVAACSPTPGAAFAVRSVVLAISRDHSLLRHAGRRGRTSFDRRTIRC